MNKEDYPVIVFNGRRLLVVPEPPVEGSGDAPRCLLCHAWTGSYNERPDCERLRLAAEDQGFDCDPDGEEDGPGPVIYLPEEHAQEYVVELVRRRVSS